MLLTECKVTVFVFIVLAVITANNKACCVHGSKPPDKNKICQGGLGADYVWDEHVRTCVRCTSCTPEALDPHCVKCRELGIIPIEDTTPQFDAGSTPFPPSSTPTNVTNDANKGNEAPGVALWIIMACVGVVILVILILVWKFKYKIMASPMTQPTQETGSPGEKHTMVPSTDGSENQAAVAV